MAPDSGLGHIGLRDRIESLGGSFQVYCHPEGTRIEMSLLMTAWKDDG
jgi:signal transduction histidine kinase